MLDKFKEKLSDMNLAIREAIKSADFEKIEQHMNPTFSAINTYYVSS